MSMKIKNLLSALVATTFLFSGLFLPNMKYSADETKSQEGKSAEEYTGDLILYTPHDPKPLTAALELFRKTYPNISVQEIQAGTGELLQRIAAESQRPIADVIWGGGADSLASYVEYFEPYVSVNDEVIDKEFKDKDHLWTGESPLPMVFVYNKKFVSDEDAPKTWEDLCDEKFKGKIAFANPAKSGSGYTQLCTMIFSQENDEKGWDLVKKFYANLDGKLQDGSSNCHKLVATGEYHIGLTLEKSAVQYADNPDIGVIYPEKNSAVPDGVAIIKGAPNMENAKLFLDFVTGKECQIQQNKEWGRRPVRNDIVPEGLLPLDELKLGSYDFEYASKHKDEIISKWNDVIIG